MTSGQSWAIQRVRELSPQLAALRILLGELPVEEQALTHRMLAEILRDPRQRENLLLYQATKQNKVGAVVLAQLQAGRTASIWPPRGNHSGAAKIPLLQTLLADLKTTGVLVAQALLSLDTESDRLTLEATGFQRAAELVYLTAERDIFPTEPPITEIEWDEITPTDDRLFRILEATYQGSLDCPLIDGWRAITDVIAGYLTVGTFRHDLWRIARVGTLDIGCVILADYPGQQQWELVYFGVHPQQRGHGWGAVIAHWLLWQARQARVQRVILAVDSTNQPARRVYTEAGFREFERRQVLAKKL